MPDGCHGTENPRCSLEASLAELRRRLGAVGSVSCGHTGYWEELAVFREFAGERGLLPDTPPEALRRPPDDEGNEHQVWYESSTESYLKATWPDFFGKRVVYAPDDSADASPVGYLDRWSLHNELFGDTVEFLGAWQSPLGLRLVIRQAAIAGRPANEEQIRLFFEETGWQPFRVGLDLAYFDEERHIAVSDTHPGNLVLTDDGTLVPIDLRIERLSPHLLEAVRRLVREF